jgi:hypothetical protein
VAIPKVTVVAGEDATKKLASAALVAVTEQVPALIEVNVDPLTAHPVAVPLMTVKVTAPVPDPPDVVRVSGVEKVPEVEVTERAAWVASAKVTVVAGDEAGAKLASPALVALTEQVPAEVEVNVDPPTAHPVAVPLVTVKVTAPVPDPPDVVRVSGVEKVPEVEVTERAAWRALPNVTVVGEDDATKKLASAALVAVTTQVPAVVAVRFDPLTAQPVAVPLVTAKVTAPVPEPPNVVRVSGAPKVPDVEVTVSAAWVAPAKVTVVAGDEVAAKVASAALVAVTEQVPEDVVVKVEPLTAQPVAVPLVTAKVTAPVPEPPNVVRVSGAPATPLVEVTVSAA